MRTQFTIPFHRFASIQPFARALRERSHLACNIRMTSFGMALALTLSSCCTAPVNFKPTPPSRVLFVGNSFTFWNDGLWSPMEEIATSRNVSQPLTAERVVRGGASLKVLWKRTSAVERIKEGDFDVVVLQEDLPETQVSTFHEYAAKFDELVRASGARPVFFMTWDYERLGWISMDEIAHEHRVLATQLGADVAPAGLAWKRAMRDRPDVDMYDRDREHPSVYGSHLNLLVIYATIYGDDPAALNYMPAESWSITAEEDAWLRQVAWQTVREFQEHISEFGSEPTN
jgi:hypothetical protein